MSQALQLAVARNWRSLAKSLGFGALVAGDKYALVLGPADIGASETAVNFGYVVVPVTSTLVAVRASGFPDGTTTVDVYLEDGSAATILDAAIALDEPSALGGAPIEVVGVGAVADSAHSAGTLLSGRATTGAGEGIDQLVVEMIFTVDA